MAYKVPTDAELKKKEQEIREWRNKLFPDLAKKYGEKKSW